MSTRAASIEVPETKRKLVEAGVNLMRIRGYNATTVDEICSAAGVTKGGFFHYFKSKEEIARAALEYFFAGKARAYEEADFRQLEDPLERVLGRLDFVVASSGGGTHTTKGCLFGVFAQEMAFTSPEFQSACQGYFSKIAGDFEKDLAAAKAAYAPGSSWQPKRVAWLYVALVQGSLLLAKTAGSNRVLVANLEEFRQYLQALFGGSRRPTRAEHAPVIQAVAN